MANRVDNAAITLEREASSFMVWDMNIVFAAGLARGYAIGYLSILLAHRSKSCYQILVYESGKE